MGITMFDVRNGTPEASEGTPYGEKIFVLKPGQRLPYPLPLEEEGRHHQLLRRHADDPALHRRTTTRR
jgi:hypothetical protein